jgi:hypothetical protein
MSKDGKTYQVAVGVAEWRDDGRHFYGTCSVLNDSQVRDDIWSCYEPPPGFVFIW